VAQISREESDRLLGVIAANDYLCRLRDEIMELHRVVFHDNEHADWSRVQDSATQILMAELANRYGGRADSVHFALCSLEKKSRSWDAAIRELASQIHSYYTTPLGIVMRQDLFGGGAVFITPDAYEWTAQVRGHQSAGSTG
jgi:hypothetical protein